MKNSETKRSKASESFQRFEDLTKRLLSVPKDEAREAERKRRKSGKSR
jgi:hypothetical protein